MASSVCCRPIPADHYFLSRTAAELLELPKHKDKFSDEQKQVWQ